MNYVPTGEQIDALAGQVIAKWDDDESERTNGAVLFESDAFQSIIRAARAEALREFGRYADGIWKTTRIPHPADTARRYADRIEVGDD